MTRLIGLTGGIASGKSTASNILKELGATIIDADRIARKIVKKGNPALSEIEEYFGKDILLSNGELNRKKLANIVFNNKEDLKKLNEITHPYIYMDVSNEINYHKDICKKDLIILDAALLIESDLIDLVEEIWLVAVSEEIQLKRLMDRDKISREDAKSRINTQMPLEIKKQYANRIIDNSKDIDYLKLQLGQILGI